MITFIHFFFHNRTYVSTYMHVRLGLAAYALHQICIEVSYNKPHSVQLLGPYGPTLNSYVHLL